MKVDRPWFNNQAFEWSTPPVGGENTSTKSIVGFDQVALCNWVMSKWHAHYSQPSNANNKYRDYLGLDHTQGKRVMDFGCGFGFDALSYAMNKNHVAIADVSFNNLRAASLVMLAAGYLPIETIAVDFDPPYFESGKFDVIHSSGVLHHIPYAPQILTRLADVLDDDGEIRLMLYTDHMWRQATGSITGPIDQDVSEHSEFDAYVRYCDAVGFYADWYDRDKADVLAGKAGLRMTFYEYIRNDRGFCVVKMVKKA